MFRTTNPALTESAFQRARNYGVGEPMTIQGAINKSFILLGLLLLSAIWIWRKAYQPAIILENITKMPSSIVPIMMTGLIAGLVFAMVTIFKKEWAHITAPIYAICEGLALGGISAIYEMQYQGIVFQAVVLTSGTLFCMLIAYRSGMIRATEKFKLGIVAATGAIFIVYMVNFIMGFFHSSIPFINNSGPVGIGFSLIVVVIAALNLVLDFDLIEKGAQAGAPKYMEWYGAFGLMVTLVWLYIEILRLLSKLRRR